MEYTIGEAAKATGRSKATISKAIKDGRLSARRAGSMTTSPYAIDAAELHRVFPIPSTFLAHPNTIEHPAPSPSNSSTAALETEVRLLREMLERERQLAEDLRKQLDQTLRLLPAPAAAATTLWQRLFGRR